MKSLFTALIVMLLAGCTIGQTKPAHFSVGAPRHHVEPPGSSIAGYKTIEFPVRVMNTSRQPIWIFGLAPNWPFYNIYVRQKEAARWVNQTEPLCGMCAAFHKLAPGTFAAFKVWVPADQAGQQLRVELPIFEAPYYQANQYNAVSDVLLIR